MTARCADCDRPMVSQRIPREERPAGTVGHCGRGLCMSCASRHRRHGTLLDFERHTLSHDEFIVELELLAGEGYTRRQIAERLGMRPAAFDRRYWRLRAAGLLSLTIQRGAA